MIATFLLQLGAGCFFGVLPVPAGATGRAFNRFVAALGGGILLLGLAAGWQGSVPARTRPLWALAALFALAAAAASHAGRTAPGRVVLQGGAAFAAAALVLDAVAMAHGAALGGLQAAALALDAARSGLTGGGPDAAATARLVLDSFGSSWLLGSVLVAMILGHYYLNIAGLAIEHLIRLCQISMAAVGLRTLSAIWGLAVDGPAVVGPWLAGDLTGADILTLVVLLQRLLFGIAGGALLTTMAWRTARIGSTQSATGILYVALIAVLVGELASRYLLIGTGHPV